MKQESKNLFIKLLKESLNEVNWERFSDVNKTCMSADNVAKMLNDELDRLKIPSSKRPKRDKDVPSVSKGNIPTDDDAKANIKQFIQNITKTPKTFFDIGEKSKHSVDAGTMTVNTGIPALRSVLWDSDNKEFYVLNTCPGAGSCIANCYALHGFYIMNDGKNLKLINRLQMLMDHPEEYEKGCYRDCEMFAFQAKRDGKLLRIRWNDAGDFFSQTYFDIAVKVTNKLISNGYNVESYAYTKVGKFIDLGNKSGMVMNFSLDALAKEKGNVDLKNSKISATVPTNVFSGIFETLSNGRFVKGEDGKPVFKDKENGRDVLKKLVKEWTMKDRRMIEVGVDIPLESIVYTDELPMSQSTKFKYNVIVLPTGDSDTAAQRRDVRFSFLLEH